MGLVIEGKKVGGLVIEGKKVGGLVDRGQRRSSSSSSGMLDRVDPATTRLGLTATCT